MRKAGFFKGGRFMAKGLTRGEKGDTLQMESVFLIKLLSRFSWFELFHLVQWKRAFPLAPGAALAALVRDAESSVLAEEVVIARRRNAVSAPKPRAGSGDCSALRQQKARGSSAASQCRDGRHAERAPGHRTSSGLGTRLLQASPWGDTHTTVCPGASLCIENSMSVTVPRMVLAGLQKSKPLCREISGRLFFPQDFKIS